MLRKISMAVMLAGAVGVPYAVWNGDQVSDWTNGLWPPSTQTETPASPTTPIATSRTAMNTPARARYNPTSLSSNATNGLADPKVVAPAPLLLTGNYQNSLSEVLRMDISPAWVNGRWARVTTTLADTGYDGRRVAYISGTQESDVSGSLTYYFDQQQVVQRITFHGTTGDPQQIVAYLTGSLEFEKREGLGGEIYSRKWLGRTTSVCLIKPAAVIQSGEGVRRYEVLLELNRATWKSNLSDAAKRLVEG